MSEQRRADHREGPAADRSRQIIVQMPDASTDNDVVLWAARVACDERAELTVVRSWIPLLGELRPAAQRAAAARLLSEMRSWARPAEDLQVPVRYQVLQGDDVESLCNYAEYQNAHLVVVHCDRRRSWLGLDSGTALHRVARATHSPLAIVPPGGSAHGLRHLLLAANESASSRSAAEWVAGIARHHEADVDAVAVFEPVVEWVPSEDPRSMVHMVRGKLENSWTAPLAVAGIRHRTEVIEGARVAEALTHYAREHHLDAIVVGAGDHPGSFHSSNMAIHLVHHSGLPVIIVPVDRTGERTIECDSGRTEVGAP